MTLIRVQVPQGTFTRPPIALVACQVNFESILGLSEAGFVAPFQEALRSRYPVANRVGVLQINIGGDASLSTERPESGGWAFSSSDGKWQIGLGRDNLTLQSTDHVVSYDELRDRFLDVVELFVEQFQPGAQLRLGLRYINRLAFDDASTIDTWRRLVRPELLGLAAADELVEQEDVKQSFGQARFARDEDQMLVSYGFLEAGTLTHPAVAPQPLPHFLLDIDQFDVRRHESIDLDETRRVMDGWHDDIHRLFRWALTNEGVERLGPADSTTDEGQPTEVVSP